MSSPTITGNTGPARSLKNQEKHQYLNCRRSGVNLEESEGLNVEGNECPSNTLVCTILEEPRKTPPIELNLACSPA